MSVEFANHVVRQLVDAGYLAYWAGGCVRDFLRGVTPNDYDVATNATPEQVRAVFGPRRSLPVGESFGVILVLGPKGSKESVEVATFRREGEYLDGRRPDRVEFCSPEEDASRRDFTINGMFFDPLTQTVLDYVNGQQDLQNKLIRAIGNAHDRMTEDKLRMLRAVRFTAALDFELDPDTARAIQAMADQVRIVSAERISQEFRKMLAAPQRSHSTQLCAELGLLNALLPEVQQFTIDRPQKHWERLLTCLQTLGDASFELAMAVLLRDVPVTRDRKDRYPDGAGTVHAICRRWKLSNNESQRICWLSEHRGSLADLPESTLARKKRLAAHAEFRQLLQLERTVACVSGENLAAYDWIENFLQQTSAQEINPPQLLTGADLLKQGHKAGPQFKEWLWTVREAQLNCEIATKAEALELVRRLSNESSHS